MSRLPRPWLPALVAAAVLCVALFGWRLTAPPVVSTGATPGTAPAGALAAHDSSELRSAEARLVSADALTSQLRGLMDLEDRLLATAVAFVPEEQLLRGEALKFYDDATRVASGLWEGLPSDWVRALRTN